ncbi:MAG TPA: substrate-binding domain-containing protein [Solirubrobacteraceae bacterium]
MKTGSILTILAAVAAVVVAAVVASGGGGDGGGGSKPGSTARTQAVGPAGAQQLSFVVSPEKEQLLKAVVAKFNASGEQVAGKRVFVSMKAMNSGDAENAIARGRLQPEVWSPAGSFWGRLLNLRADQPFVANDNPSIVRTPLVIAMWEPMARALGYPRKPVAFEDIVKLATDPQGWASVGKPNFGRFKYVHTNPDSSTSGAEAVTGSYYSLVGKKEGLTNADVAKAAPRVKDLERSVVHYGDSTLFIEDQLCKGGLAYASAVAMEETTVIDFNRRRCSNTKLVSLYPREGSFFSDSPYIVLNADWVTPADRQAAAAFRKFLAGEVDADLAGRYGFRPGDPEGKPAGLVTAANGADPAQPRRELALPEPPVLNRVLTTWRRDRKPARVMLVLDNSGSMQDEDKLVHAKQGLLAFFRQVAPQDEIGLTKFSAKVTQLVAPAPFAGNRDALTRAVNGIIPEDDTAVYDATVDAVDAIKAKADSEHINAVVVLTDGADTTSSVSGDQVLARLGQEGKAESNAVRVFTIAYGSDAKASELQRFAEASGGKAFTASTADIEQVYRSISSFF